MTKTIAILVAAAALAGCASTGSGPDAYEALVASCKERGGELRPIPGAKSNNEAANYACEFKGAGPTSGR